MPRKPSHKVTFEDAVEIWKLYSLGHFPQRIAGKIDCNVGRIYEVLKEEKHVGSKGVAIRAFEIERPSLAKQLKTFKFKAKEESDDSQGDLFRPSS